MAVVHEVKSWPAFYQRILDGTRTHELRRDDRGYQIGDTLCLREYDPGTGAYTGASCDALITSLTSDAAPCAVSDRGLADGYCILSIRVAPASRKTGQVKASKAPNPAG